VQQPESSFDVRDLLWKVRRHRWLPFLPLVAALCVGVIYIRITPRLYQSFVVVSYGDQTPISAALQPLVQTQRDNESLLDKTSRVNARIHSRSFLAAMVARLGLNRDPELLLEASAETRRWRGVSPDDYAMRTASTRLARKIIVAPVGQSFIRISAIDRDPYSAQRIALTIADALIEEGQRSTMERMQARGEFSADQIAVYEERLRKSEAALRAYEESIIGRKLGSNLVDEGNLDQARALVRSIDEEMDQIKGRIESDLGEWRRRSGGAVGPPQLQSDNATQLEARLVALESAYSLTSLKPARVAGDDENASMEQKIGRARASLLAEYEAVAASLGAGIPEGAGEIAAGVALDRAELRSLREKRSQLTKLIGAYAQSVQESPREQLELERLRQEVQTNRDLLLALRKEATSSRISEALETSQLGLKLEIVEAPQLPLGPFYPDRLRILMAALAIGTLAGVGVVFAVEKLAAVVRTVEQAEHEIGAKVIGTVPRIEGWGRPGSYLHRQWPLLSILLVLVVTGLFISIYGAVVSERPAPGKTAGAPR
jgi:polysaccharide biosynthesis transport protein